MQKAEKIDTIVSNEICSLTMVKRLATMLDLNSQHYKEGDVLPLGWHFFMLAGETRKSEIRKDGFPGLGVPIPDLGLPRLLLGGRTVSYKGEIIIGAPIEKTSFIKNITKKETKTGSMAIVTIQHDLRPISDICPAIVETQTYILLSAKKGGKEKEIKTGDPIIAKYQKPIVPDETLLFQYSALGFNSHKIHLDRDYTRNVEGLPDLVVNGGLATLLITEFLRTDLGLEIKDIKVKHVAPLYCGRKMTVAAYKDESDWKIKVFDEKNMVAVEMETKTIERI